MEPNWDSLYSQCGRPCVSVRHDRFRVENPVIVLNLCLTVFALLSWVFVFVFVILILECRWGGSRGPLSPVAATFSVNLADPAKQGEIRI